MFLRDAWGTTVVFRFGLPCALALCAAGAVRGGESAGPWGVSGNDSKSAEPSLLTELLTCDPRSILAHPPHTSPSQYEARTSDLAGGRLVFDEYATNEQVCAVEFWGFDAFWNGTQWFDCTEDPTQFVIRFYADNAGLPGALVASYTVTPVREPTGVVFPAVGELIRYRAELSPCCPLQSGWLSVVAVSVGGTPTDCWFLWQSSPVGDTRCLQYNIQAGLLFRQPFDRAFCLRGTRGACCFPAPSCERLSPADCAAAGGTYLGDGTTCEPGLCRAPGDRCDDPLPVPALPFTDARDSCAYFDDYDVACPFLNPGGRDVVYRYVASENACLRISLCDGPTSFGTKLYVWANSCPGAGPPLPCNDDACTSTSGTPGVSRLCLNVTAGTTYYIVVDSNSTACGAYTLTISADTGPPTFTGCPAGLSVPSDPGRCDAVVTWVPPAVEAPCGLSAFGSNLAPGAVLPVGVTTVTYTATDTCGRTAMCSFDVTVFDAEPPTLTCPPDVTLPTDPGGCLATGVVLGTPITGDNCGVTGVTNDAPPAFPLGTTVVTWTARDAAGNVATCTQTITVQDLEAPQFTACPEPVTLPANVGETVPLPDLVPLAAVADNCSGPVAVTQTPPPGTPLSFGVHPVTLTARDAAGNAAECQTTVRVVSAGPAQVALLGDRKCYAPGETVRVEAWMLSIPANINGLQAFLQYDPTRLELVSVTPAERSESPFVIEIFECSTAPDGHEGCTPQAGEVDVAVGTPFGTTGTGDAQMVVLTFIARTRICSDPSLVAWRPHDPPTMLSVEEGEELTPPLKGLSVNDTPPRLVGPSAVAAPLGTDCATAVQFSATLNDACCLDPDRVVVDARVVAGSGVLGSPSIAMTPSAGRIDVSGSVPLQFAGHLPTGVQVTVFATDCCNLPAGTPGPDPAPGRWTESYPNHPSEDGSVVSAADWDGGTLGTQWRLSGATRAGAPTLLWDTHTGDPGGGGEIAWRTSYAGGTLELDAALLGGSGMVTGAIVRHTHEAYHVYVGGSVDPLASWTQMTTHAVFPTLGLGVTLTARARLAGSGASSPWPDYPDFAPGHTYGRWGRIESAELTLVSSALLTITDDVRPVILPVSGPEEFGADVAARWEYGTAIADCSGGLSGATLLTPGVAGGVLTVPLPSSACPGALVFTGVRTTAALAGGAYNGALLGDLSGRSVVLAARLRTNRPDGSPLSLADFAALYGGSPPYRPGLSVALQSAGTRWFYRGRQPGADDYLDATTLRDARWASFTAYLGDHRLWADAAGNPPTPTQWAAAVAAVEALEIVATGGGGASGAFALATGVTGHLDLDFVTSRGATFVHPADAGVCSARLALPAVPAGDACGPVSVSYAADLDDNGEYETPLADPSTFTVGATPIRATATDGVGLSASWDFRVVVAPQNAIDVTVRLSGAYSVPVTRCLTFELRRCGDPAPVTFERQVTFPAGTNPVVNLTLFAPCGAYDCLSVRDPLHSLRASLPAPELAIVGGRYVGDFAAAGRPLVTGDLNADHVIDVLDFGVFLSLWQRTAAPPVCGTPAPQADLNGDGVVNTADFTFIHGHYLRTSDPACCESGGPGFAPVTDISVDELHARGLGALAVADLTADGRLNAADITAFLNGIIPGMRRGDLNCDGHVNFDDIDPFVLALSGRGVYESSYPNCIWMNADCNADGAVGFDDIDAFVLLIGS